MDILLLYINVDGADDDNNSNNVKNYNMAAIMTIINREIFSMRM